MGTKVRTDVSLRRAIVLCVFAIFAPERFAKEEVADNALLKAALDLPAEAPVFKVRRALSRSLLLVMASGGIGVVAGLTSRLWHGPACPSTIAVLQVAGTLIVLWATLAVRGWDILTYVSVTLSERVNQWIYRFLYCCGTLLLVWSVSWPTHSCAPPSNPSVPSPSVDAQNWRMMDG